MIEHVDAFITLLSGIGTLEEIFIIASWAHLNIHLKHIWLFELNHCYGLLMMFLDNAMRHDFISTPPQRIFVHAKVATELIDPL